MMSKIARNETLELIANGFNGVAVTIAGAGIVLPVLSVYFEIGPEVRNLDLIWYLVIDAALCVLGLHMAGQYVIGEIGGLWARHRILRKYTNEVALKAPGRSEQSAPKSP